METQINSRVTNLGYLLNEYPIPFDRLLAQHGKLINPLCVYILEEAMTHLEHSTFHCVAFGIKYLSCLQKTLFQSVGEIEKVKTL